MREWVNLVFSKSWTWAFISLFLFGYYGYDLMLGVTQGEMELIKPTGTVAYDQAPVLFLVNAVLKLFVWILSSLNLWNFVMFQVKRLTK